MSTTGSIGRGELIPGVSGVEELLGMRCGGAALAAAMQSKMRAAAVCRVKGM
jgi:hypothetical protein